MSTNPSKLSRFWNELKRRRVIHVITVYASGAFVLIELINNLAEPLHLPENLTIIVIIALAVAFPLVVVFSWLYDLTSAGVEKTKPIDEISERQATIVPNAWRIATIISFMVIVGLVTLNILVGTRGLRPGDIRSLVILPFDNFSGDDQLDWVAAGMHSSLIGDMGKVTGLRVLGKTTSAAYKETDMTATDIANKHNVDAMVESTLTCYGDMICVQVRVVTPYPEEKLLWVEDFIEEKNQMLNLQNRIVKKIANELKVNLSPQEENLLAESRAIDPDAIDAYLKGLDYLDKINPESLSAAKESFEKAIEIEPDWAAPYGGLAELGSYEKQMGFGSESDIIIMIYENLIKALELDPNSVEAHHTKAVIAAWTEFDWKTAEEEFLKAIELNPSSARSHSFYAHVLTILRRTDEALYEGKLSVELDPENPFTLGLYVEVLHRNGLCRDARYYYEKALSIDPDHYFLGGSHEVYECSGDYEKAFAIMKGWNYTLWEEYGVAELFEKVFQERGWIAVMEEAIRVNEEVWAKDGHLIPLVQAGKYVTVGNYDKALDYYEMTYENNNHNPNLPYISCKSTYDRMKDYPRYHDLLKKMNLPVSP